MICYAKTFSERIESGELSEIDCLNIEVFLHNPCPHRKKLADDYSRLVIRKHNEKKRLEDPTICEQDHKAHGQKGWIPTLF